MTRYPGPRQSTQDRVTRLLVVIAMAAAGYGVLIGCLS